MCLLLVSGWPLVAWRTFSLPESAGLVHQPLKPLLGHSGCESWPSGVFIVRGLVWPHWGDWPLLTSRMPPSCGPAYIRGKASDPSSVTSSSPLAGFLHMAKPGELPESEPHLDWMLMLRGRQLQPAWSACCIQQVSRAALLYLATATPKVEP